jgi:hypothetical protein
MRSSISNLKHRIKYGIFYRRFPLFYLYEKFMYPRYRLGVGDGIISAPSGRTYRSAEVIAELKRNGIAMLPGYYSPAHADAMYEEVIALNEDVRSGKIPADVKGDLFSGKVEWSKVLEGQGIIRVHNVQKVSAKARAFHEDPNFSLLGGLYLGKPIINLNTISQYNVPIDAGCRGFHIDSHLNQFKSFVYLNDVTDENGPHDYLLGSNAITLKNMKRAFTAMKTMNTGVSDAEVEATGYRHKTFPGPKGTVLLVDTRGIHQGANLKSGHRLALTGYYYLAEDWPDRRD